MNLYQKNFILDALTALATTEVMVWDGEDHAFLEELASLAGIDRLIIMGRTRSALQRLKGRHSSLRPDIFRKIEYHNLSLPPAELLRNLSDFDGTVIAALPTPDQLDSSMLFSRLKRHLFTGLRPTHLIIEAKCGNRLNDYTTPNSVPFGEYPGTVDAFAGFEIWATQAAKLAGLRLQQPNELYSKPKRDLAIYSISESHQGNPA